MGRFYSLGSCSVDWRDFCSCGSSLQLLPRSFRVRQFAWFKPLPEHRHSHPHWSQPMSRVHPMQSNPVLAQLLTRQQNAQAKETGASLDTAIQSLVQGGTSLSGTGNQASGHLYGTDSTVQAPVTQPTQVSQVQSTGQDTLSISAAALQALQGQAPMSEQSLSAGPTYPNYQMQGNRQNRPGDALSKRYP
jgi:hypothetical protein